MNEKQSKIKTFDISIPTKASLSLLRKLHLKILIKESRKGDER